MILGLLREPALAGEYRDELDSLDIEEKEAEGIIEAILALSDEGRLEVRELATLLRDRPGAMQRVIGLASETRRFDARAVVEGSLASLRERRARKDYEQVRARQKALLESRNSQEADKLLLELDKKLRLQKGIKERAEEQ